MGSEDFDRIVYISAGWFGSSLSAAILGGGGMPLAHLGIDIDRVAFILILIRLQQS